MYVLDSNLVIFNLRGRANTHRRASVKRKAEVPSREYPKTAVVFTFRAITKKLLVLLRFEYFLTIISSACFRFSNKDVAVSPEVSDRGVSLLIESQTRPVVSK